ncbi:unnamed protein product [Lactuca virosa]|uniref:Uncharacterized protein n=1 Tax=Lactuca virosa TaxID=75947 RepID=A0AAU9P7R8_9ASTR|nr:unnamed protein product [Lactuca virosa]
MKPVLTKLIGFLNVTSSRATTQQWGEDDDKEANKGEIPVNKDEILEVNLRNPYETGKMAKSDAAKVVLEKQSLKDKLKNFREVKTGRKGNVSSGSGKGKVNIVSEGDGDLNPNLSEKELKEREKFDKELDELNALKVKFEAKENFFENILTSKKAMFPEWTTDRI